MQLPRCKHEPANPTQNDRSSESFRLSVQTLYQNAFLVLAACVAGGVVCARHRQWRTAVWVLGVGLAAGVSLAPYAPLIIQSQSWWILQKTGFDLARIGCEFSLA